MHMNDPQKVALVTGSSAGIGSEIARGLSCEGYAVILTGSRPEEQVVSLLDEISKHTSGVYIRGDIARRETRELLVKTVDERFGRLDVLVNNAGVTTAGRKDILLLTEEEILALIKVNLVAPWMLTSKLVALMRNHQEPAYVINISSISAYTVSTNRADYCISKAGLSMLTQQFALRLADENIRVFELRPGIIATDMTDPVKDRYDSLIGEGLLPIQRWGRSADVSRAVAGIVNGYFPYSTGEIINIDGGFHIRRL